MILLGENNIMLKNFISKAKESRLDSIKNFTALILKPKLNKEELDDYIKEHDINFWEITRVISMLYKYPKLLIWINKWVNTNRYPNFTLSDFIMTMRYIMQENNIFGQRYIYYHKSKENKFPLELQIMNLLNNYFQEKYNLYFNWDELKFYYKLFLIQKITNNDIIDIDILFNQRKTINIVDLDDRQSDNIVLKQKITENVGKLIEQQNQESAFLFNYNGTLQGLKLDICDIKCKLYKNNIIKIEGNIQENELTDVMIINLTQNKKFNSISNSLIRQQIDLFPKSVKWVMVNLICCQLKSKTQIGSDELINKQLGLCNNLFNQIKNNFPAKLYLLVGNAWNYYLHKDPIDGINDEYAYIYPDEVSTPELKQKAVEQWKNIQDYLINKPKKKEVILEESVNPKEKVPAKKVINDKDLLLLTVEEIDEKHVLCIYTDKQGNKICIEKPNIIVGKVTYNNYNECSILKEGITEDIKLNRKQKNILNSELKKAMQKLKNVDISK